MTRGRRDRGRGVSSAGGSVPVPAPAFGVYADVGGDGTLGRFEFRFDSRRGTRRVPRERAPRHLERLVEGFPLARDDGVEIRTGGATLTRLRGGDAPDAHEPPAAKRGLRARRARVVLRERHRAMKRGGGVAHATLTRAKRAEVTQTRGRRRRRRVPRARVPGAFGGAHSSGAVRHRAFETLRRLRPPALVFTRQTGRVERRARVENVVVGGRVDVDVDGVDRLVARRIRPTPPHGAIARLPRLHRRAIQRLRLGESTSVSSRRR